MITLESSQHVLSLSSKGTYRCRSSPTKILNKNTANHKTKNRNEQEQKPEKQEKHNNKKWDNTSGVKSICVESGFHQTNLVAARRQQKDYKTMKKL